MPDIPFPHLQELLGKEFRVSDWETVDQAVIDRFADATGDHQWIHVNPARAKAESPFGATIAHGFLSLSLLPKMMGDFFVNDAVAQALNYGCNMVRFPSPVLVNSRIRGRFTMKTLEEGPMGSVKCTVTSTIEVEGTEKPACVAVQVFLLFPVKGDA